MYRTHVRLNMALAACIALGASSVLSAQAPGSWDPFMKLRAQVATKVDEGQQSAFGVGFGANTKLGAGTLGLELNYTFNPGSEQTFVPANSVGATPFNSVQTSKHSTSQIGIRASYGMPIVDDWGWQVGLDLGMAKDTLESNGTFEYSGSALPDGAWNLTPNKSSLAATPFVGLTYKTSEFGNVEINAVYVNYKRAEENAVFSSAKGDWTGAVPVLGSSSYGSFRIEVGYVFHF